MTAPRPVEPSARGRIHLAAQVSEVAFASFERFARTAERGLFDFVLLGEEPAGGAHRDGVHDPEAAGGPEPLTVLNALVSVTARLGLAAPVDTTFNEPYELARRFATADRLSGGRAAWNVVSSSDATTGENFRRGDFLGRTGPPRSGPSSSEPSRSGQFLSGRCPDRATALARAAEFVATAREVWDAWTPDGVSRPFVHRGRHFDIAGEFTVPRSPQGHPVVLRAGDSPVDREFAASAADVLLTLRGTPDASRTLYADVKGRLARYGRGHDELKIMPRAAFVLGATVAEAREKATARDGRRAEDSFTMAEKGRSPAPEKGLPRRWAGSEDSDGLLFAGTPESVAAEIDALVRTGAADGFVLVPHPTPGGLDEFVDRVVPLLQERGAFRTEYTGTTLRSHLGLPEPVWKG